jgi:D-alanyl-lipoteichoic acid acyltransferase DltB (MBOAT superfamily)
MDVLAIAGFHSSEWTLSILLPVGISFFVFQEAGYLIDVYRQELEPCRKPVDFLVFIAFFPQLLAGPIARGPHLLPQFERAREFNAERAADGVAQIIWGFFMKTVMADRLAPFVDVAFGDGNSLVL